MATLIKKDTTPTFIVGDKVQFNVIAQHDNYSPTYITAYGFVGKVNKVTMTILGVDGQVYKEKISQVRKYVYPFEALRYIFED